MKITHTIEETRVWSREARRGGRRLGVVPTMGALHEGHLSLIRAARAQSDLVGVSLFVNPLQFGPNEDFARYPRTFERDREFLEAEGVSVLFAPAPEEMYPGGETTFVEVEGLSSQLEGKTRPGHFRGVTTVVSKLFHIFEPDMAFFGQKDAQQVAIIRKMVRDLDFGVDIVVCPIVREADGLALSSRNRYLDPAQRRAATVLNRALIRIQTLAIHGERCATELIRAGQEIIAAEPAVRLDYLAIVDEDTLEPLKEVREGALVPIAAYVGNTRLIDNIVLLGTGEVE
jgi:pantoate--beta-alanine ligase